MDIQKLIKDAERADSVASLMDGVNPHHVLELAIRLAEAEAQLSLVTESREQWEANAHEFSRCAYRLEAQLAELAKQEPDFYAVYGSKGNLHSHCGSIHLARTLAKDIGGTFEGLFTRSAPPAPVKLPRGHILDCFGRLETDDDGVWIHKDDVIEALKAADVEVADE